MNLRKALTLCFENCKAISTVEKFISTDNIRFIDNDTKMQDCTKLLGTQADPLGHVFKSTKSALKTYYRLNCVSPKFVCQSPKHPVLQNVPGLEIRSLQRKSSKMKPVGWALIQYD